MGLFRLMAEDFNLDDERNCNGIAQAQSNQKDSFLASRTVLAIVRLFGIQTVADDSVAQVRKKVTEYNMQVRAYNQR